jgi:hypothetical protein
VASSQGYDGDAYRRGLPAHLAAARLPRVRFPLPLMEASLLNSQQLGKGGMRRQRIERVADCDFEIQIVYSVKIFKKCKKSVIRR